MAGIFHFIVISGLLLASFSAASQDIRLELGKTKISQEEAFSITVIFPKENKNDYQAFPFSAFPEIPDFAKISTRYFEDKEQGNFKIIQLYQPLKSGRFKLYPFRIQTGETEISSEGATLLVTPSDKPFKSPPISDLEYEESHSNLLFQVIPNKKDVYIGEGIEITASLLISENSGARFNFINLLQQITHISGALSPENSFLDEFSPGVLSEPFSDTIEIQGIKYRRITFYEGKFYPLSEKNLTFPSFSFGILNYQVAKSDQTVYWKSETLSLTSKPFSIEVKPLPEHPLKGQVPVGKFSLKEGLSNNKVKAGKHFIYRAIITGEGNFITFSAPELPENDLMDFYSPVLKQRVIKEGKNAGGKILEFTIIPKEPGTYHLSDYFKWVYFNPSEKKYDTLYSRMVVHVEGESQKDREISLMDLGSFYELLSKESNQLRSREKDESINFFANIIILFMLVTTAILVFKR